VIVHPDLRALRGDDSPQRDAQQALYAALGAWRGQSRVACLREALAAFAAGANPAELSPLAKLFDPASADATALAHGFATTTARALAEAPLGHVPLRHFTDGTSSTLLLARAGNATLSLVAIDGEGLRGQDAPASASFAPVETWEHVLSGQAKAELVDCEPTGPRQARLTRHAADMSPGTVIIRDGVRQARLIHAIEGCLVSLRLQRRQPQAGPTREYDLATGELLHQAAGNPRDSRVELMIALLGRMGRADAAPAIAGMATGEGSTALRWQALRECLALDSGEGFRALCRIAATAVDPLAAPAGALRAQLIEAHPQLEAIA